MSATSPNLMANGDIAVSTFVKLDTSADNAALQAGAGDKAIAVSTEAAGAAPITGASGLAASQNQQLRVYGVGEICNLLAGSGGFTRGSFLKSDANGAGVAASVGDYYGAVALESAGTATLGRVQVLFGKL